MLFRKRVAEKRGIRAKIVDCDAALRHARGPACFKHIGWLPSQALRNPSPNRPAPKPFVLEWREFSQIIEGAHFLERIKIQPALEIEPKRAAGGVVKMPGNRLGY